MEHTPRIALLRYSPGEELRLNDALFNSRG